jgi:hypothetical protein
VRKVIIIIPIVHFPDGREQQKGRVEPQYLMWDSFTRSSPFFMIATRPIALLGIFFAPAGKSKGLAGRCL